MRKICVLLFKVVVYVRLRHLPRFSCKVFPDSYKNTAMTQKDFYIFIKILQNLQQISPRVIRYFFHSPGFVADRAELPHHILFRGLQWLTSVIIKSSDFACHHRMSCQQHLSYIIWLKTSVLSNLAVRGLKVVIGNSRQDHRSQQGFSVL